MDNYFLVCLIYVISIFSFRENVRKNKPSTIKRFFGWVLISVAILFVIGLCCSVYLYYNSNVYRPTPNYHNTMFATTFFGGWGIFLLVCDKPYRVLWRRISILVAYILWSLLLLIGVNHGDIPEMGLLLSNVFFMCVMYYLKEGYKFEHPKVRKR